MKEIVSLFGKEGWVKKTNRPIGLIVFIPGLFDNLKSSVFQEIFDIEVNFDIFACNLYPGVNLEKPNESMMDLIKDFNSILKKASNIYDKIFVISYSFSSEVLLRLPLPFQVKAVALWSPSFFYPQNITSTLSNYKGNKNILKHGDNLIGERLAKELDSFDTMSKITNLNKPLQIYTSLDEQGEKSWANPEIFKLIPSKDKTHINIDFKHQYTEKQVEELFLKTCLWFSKFQ